MKIRLKFSKQGPVKFVGHLDTMRLFQRAIKVANIPVAYSQGFSPHSLVYFAMPLAVGMSSQGEYMDIVTQIDMDPEVIKDSLNKVLVEGIVIEEAFIPKVGKDSLMSLVQGADYQLILQKTKEITTDLLQSKLEQEELIIMKKGKKGIKPVDIKPLILECHLSETEDTIQIDLKALAGSNQNLNPELFIKSLLEEVVEGYEVQVIRKELYAEDNHQLVPISEYEREQ